MFIQLIHPPVLRNPKAQTALRPSLPLGLSYIAAALREAGHAVDILDAVGEAPETLSDFDDLERIGLSNDEILARLDPRAHAFGLTNMWSFSWPLVRELIHAIKTLYPHTPIVCGGEHFTGLPELSLRQAPIDYLVLGEGEDTAVELFHALEWGARTEHIQGIAYLDGDRYVRNDDRGRRRDLDQLPWPAWDLFDVESYDQHGMVNGLRMGKTIPILATRGCPYQCTYCSAPNMWTTRYVTRDPEDVAEEIAYYNARYGATNFPFQDLTAIIKRKWIVAFCEALIERELDITWQFPSGTRCEVIDDEVAQLLRRSGGKALAFAPESGSEETRRVVGKKMKTASLLEAVSASVKNQLDISCFFVLGFPEDTVRDFRDTEKLVRKLARMGIDDVAIGFFFPLPGTKLYETLASEGHLHLDDRFLMTPIHANESRLTEEHNYSYRLSASRITWWKYRLLLNFYAISFALRPWRILKVLGNALRGKETRKLETYLAERRRAWLHGRDRGRVHQLPKPRDRAA